ncbi:hypothetical protein GPUN_1813 [Glaciecola punicea ACAM 611]|uniref:Ferredoxin C-terminal domain-containing protein n=1 Tax=Glaciecola punicea ACAM 611 TaxID=1121923 RepID=H5TCA2_9ALTE|nr:hypothetical protein GPUN_1813 [Glaciecola punicea ACAM 611]
MDAIYQDTELPDDQEAFLDINAQLCQQWPNITEIKDAPDDADEWNTVVGKLPLLEK